MKSKKLVTFNDEPKDATLDIEQGFNPSEAGTCLLELNIDEIEVDPTLQTRAEMNEIAVTEYAELMKEGHTFPPVVVFKLGETNLLVDGFHRFQAQRQNGNQKISVEVKTGTKRDAILFGIRANTQHGLSRSNADKKKAVELILSDKEWNEWAYTTIAKACGVSDSFVRKVKMATSNGSEVNEVKKYERNGKLCSMNIASISKGRSVKEAVSVSLEEAVGYLEDAIRELLGDIEHYKSGKHYDELADSSKKAAKELNAYCKLVKDFNDADKQAV